MDKNDSQIIFDRLSIKRLRDASSQLRQTKDFSFSGLKFLHDQTFLPTPNLSRDIYKLMKSYYEMRPDDNSWQKNRQVPRLQYPYVTMYSPLESGDFVNAEAAIKSALPENMINLDIGQRIKRLTSVYAEIDYLHAFWDGNSRVNRAFVQEMAHASSIVFDFNSITHEIMYVARDKSLLELNLLRRPEELKTIRHPYNKNAYIGLQEDLNDLNKYYPSVTLISVFSNIARPLEIDKRAEKVQLAEFLYDCYLNTTLLSSIEKSAERERLMYALKKSTPKEIDAFTDKLREKMHKVQETKPVSKTKDRNREDGRDR